MDLKTGWLLKQETKDSVDKYESMIEELDCKKHKEFLWIGSPVFSKWGLIFDININYIVTNAWVKIYYVDNG